MGNALDGETWETFRQAAALGTEVDERETDVFLSICSYRYDSNVLYYTLNPVS